MKLLTKTKISMLLAFITIIGLATIENGIIKTILWIAFVIEFCVFMYLADKLGVAYGK